MRNYWVRIAFGALAIFTVGMIGITLARQGVGRVRGVVEGSGPITLPIPFVPFKLDGQKLGTLDKVVLLRDAPKRISAVELQIKLPDSVMARGLEGCRLAANFDAQHNRRGVNVNVGPLSTGVFSCLQGKDSSAQLQEFGRAIFQPGGVSVPLLLPNDIVDDLKQGNFGSGDEDSVASAAQARADSIAEAANARADSITAEVEARADSIAGRTERLVDSLRTEGERRADSTRRAASRMADSARAR
ncbi:MAG TPA: hypothetical protein VGQ24_02570 [Gemmatimonadales bacterium]|nr:hypothetical protein [Gemmatimonadales bacterium]